MTACENLTRVTAAFNVSLEPAHIASMAGIDPFEVVIGMGRSGGGCDTAVIEAQLPSDELDVGIGDGGGHSWEPKW